MVSSLIDSIEPVSSGLLDRQIAELVREWSLGPVVVALQALRGVALALAAGVVAEVGDMRRFDNPRQLMAYLGLVSQRALERSNASRHQYHQSR